MTVRTLNILAFIYYLAVIAFAVLFGQTISEYYPVNVNFILNLGFFSGIVLYVILDSAFVSKYIPLKVNE
jgi:hypothetical protein